MQPFLEAPGENLFPCLRRFLAEFIPCGCRIKVAFSLQVVSWGPFQLPDAAHIAWHIASFHYLQGQWPIESLLRFKSLLSPLPLSHLSDCLPSYFTFKIPCDYIDPIWIIKDNLSLLRLGALTLSITLPSLCNLTLSDVSELKHGYLCKSLFCLSHQF